ncbi:MAG: TonB-dependent receptor [Dysgonomonas sp.]|nr:TonB-dependent receptor [Dysgonomonas sp.]
MKSKSLIFVLFIVLSIHSLFSQQGNIIGKILESSSNSPIEFANITLMTPDSTFMKGINSDNNGQFILKNVQNGNYLLSVGYIGYKTYYLNLSKSTDTHDVGSILLEPSSILLNDVIVTAQSVINKSDRKLITPSTAQVKASTNGIDLLRKLQLPRLTVDFMSNSVSLPGNGELQLRINGVQVTNTEIMAIRPEDVIRVEYHDQPGVRYGNAEIVIDYIVRRKESGGNINANGMNAIGKSVFSDNFFSGRANHKKSEFSTNISTLNRNFKWVRSNNEIFQFPDQQIQRIEKGLPTKYIENNIKTTFNYSIVENDKYFFNARFRYNYQNQPNSYTDRRGTITTTSNSTKLNIYDRTSQKQNIPALDLYYQRNLKNKQLVILNIVGTYITSNNRRIYQELQNEIPQTDILSDISGKKYSLIMEGIYEKGYSTGKLTTGLKHSQVYTHNKYRGNTETEINMNQAETFGYAEYKLNKGKINYTFNISMMRTYYRQEDSKSEKYTFRPSISTSYNINDYTFIRGRAYIWGSNPSLGDLNKVEQVIDSFQIKRGNPDLVSFNDYGGNITFGYNKGVIGLDFHADYKYLDKPVMESILFENNKFIRMQENQKSHQRLSIETSIKIRPLKEHLTISITPGINNYKSVGHTYKHLYTNPYVRINIDAMYKNWVMNFWATTAYDWFYGESMNQGEAFQMISFGYNKPKWSLMAGAMNPIGSDYKTRNENWSRLVSSRSQLIGDNLTPLFFIRGSISINFGRQFKTGNRRINNTDNDAGIMSGAKK